MDTSPPTTTSPAAAPAVLAWLESAVADLGEADWEAVSREDLPGVMARLETVRSRLDAVAIRVAGRISATRAAETAGWVSTTDFLTATTGGTKGAGPGLVRLHERLRSLPATATALAEGWLSRAKAVVIGERIASLPHHTGLRMAAESALLDSARHLDATDLARSWPEVLRRIDPDGRLLGSELALDRRERAAHRARHLSFAGDGHGGVRIKGYATVEDAELVKSALLPLSAPVRSEPGSCGGVAATERGSDGPVRAHQGTCPDYSCPHDGRDPRDGGVRLWDALVEACRRLQTTTVLPTSHGMTPRLVVTTSLEDLRAALDGSAGTSPAHPGGTLGSGDPLSASAVRRLACDAEVIPAVLGTRSELLDTGRGHRLVTAGLWQALVIRDGHCAFPGCGRLPLACDAHHVVSWVDGGTTSLANLVMLCRGHHTLLHTTAWQVRIAQHDGRPDFLPPASRDGPREWIRAREARGLAA